MTQEDRDKMEDYIAQARTDCCEIDALQEFFYTDQRSVLSDLTDEELKEVYDEIKENDKLINGGGV